MKVHLRGRPKQYSLTRITCLDSIMIDMLSCVPDQPLDISEAQVNALRNSLAPGAYIHVFLHGARLSIGAVKNEYFVQCFLPDGADGLAAIEELKMLDALRMAKRHFHAMKKACYNPSVNESVFLRVTAR